MSWNENIFKFFFRRLRNRHIDENTPKPTHCASLDEHRQHFSLLASMVFEESITIINTDGVGGLVGKQFYLPSRCDRFPTQELNLLYYVHRICRHAPSPLPGMPFFLEALWKEWNKDTHSDLEQLWFDGPAPKVGSEKEGTVETLEAHPSQDTSQKRTYESKNIAYPKPLRLDEKEENSALHIFDHVKTAEEYSSGTRNTDGSDEFDEHADALTEVNFSHVIRTQQTADTILEIKNLAISDHSVDSKKSENTASKIHYPEWNHKNSTYRKSWCTLYEDIPPRAERHSSPPSFVIMRQYFAHIFNEFRLRKHQVDGQDIDIDSIIRWRTERSLCLESTPRVYTLQSKTEQDFSVLLLLDLSQSSDSYVRNERVLDILKHTAELLIDPLEALGFPVMLSGFYSNTRHESRYIHIKTFENSWSEVYSEFQSLRPQGYSRIGPAIRHSTYILNQRRERKKILLILSDAKPTDYDAYEGTYGVHDVKKAVEEARAKRISMHCVAFAKKLTLEHHMMFGSHPVDWIHSRKTLPLQLYKLFKKLISVSSSPR